MSQIAQSTHFANQLLASKEFFERSTRVLDEADSGFRPRDEMMTVAHQVAHAAQTIDWLSKAPRGLRASIWILRSTPRSLRR